MDPVPGERPARSRPSHRQPSRFRGPRSARLGSSVALTAALALVGVGALVASGTVRMPSADGRAAADHAVLAVAPAAPAAGTAATRASAMPSFGFAVASVPATAAPSPRASKPKAAKAAPAASAPATAAATTPTTPAAATSSAAQTVAASAGAPPELPENVTPTGSVQLAWSEAILTALGAPITNANVLSMGYWMQNEAGAPPYGLRGEDNPINVSQPCCGGVPIQSDGDGVTYLQSYPTPADGVEATKEYLQRGNYTQIVADLQAGVGLGGSDVSAEISLFAGGHYDTIPDSYGASQGQPELP